MFPMRDDVDLDLKSQSFLQLPLIERSLKIAVILLELLSKKNEAVFLFSVYNMMLEENHEELIKAIAEETQERRTYLITNMFVNLVKQTQKEIIIQQHQVSKNDFYLYVLVSKVNHALLQKHDC